MIKIRVFILFNILIQFIHADDIYFYQNNKKEILKPNNYKIQSFSKYDFYTSSSNSLLGVSNKLLVKFENIANLQQYLVDYNLVIKKQLGNNLYLIESSDKSLTINISNELSLKNDIKYSHPDFLKMIQRR